ncbi:MAG: hypothetical protein V5A57_03455, partial [Candidatus Paceibacterota bacterium]
AAFITRFPAALAAIAAGFTLVIAFVPLEKLHKLRVAKEDVLSLINHAAKMSLACGLPLLGYLTLNHVFGDGFLSPIISGASVPTLNPDKYLYGFYFLKEAVIANPLLVFAPLGVFLVLRCREESMYGYLAGLAVFYGFFTFYPHKEPRFMILFLPIMAFFAAKGLKSVEIPFEVDKRKVILVALIPIFSFGFTQVVNSNTWENPARASYMAETSNLNGTVAGLNPAPTVYGDFKFMAVRPEHYERTIERTFRDADYFTLETCSWYCAPAIKNCGSKKQDLINQLESREKLFESSAQSCRYAIYKVN